MSIISTTQPALRLRVLPRFPANVVAGNGIAITRSGSRYTFSTVGVVDIPLSSLAHIPTDSLLGRDDADDGEVSAISVSGGLQFNGAGGLQISDNARIRALSFVITGSPISTGVKGDLVVPYAGIIKKVSLLGDQSGSIVVNIWKDTFANYPPTVADKITDSNPPTISAGLAMQDSTLTGWTVGISAGDILRFNVDSVSAFTRIVVCLDIQAV